MALQGTVTSLAALLNRSSEEQRFLFASLARFLKYNRIDKAMGASMVGASRFHDLQMQLGQLEICKFPMDVSNL